MMTTEASRARKLADFEGGWLVARHIRHEDGATARFSGRAVWTPADGGLRYHETGLMTLEGHPPMQAERSYFWAEDLSVFFDDGRFFHRVPARGGTTSHWCDPDHYELTYGFGDWPDFRVAWRVKGPRKNYWADTEFTRC
ncbi:MAG: DUF6314 family protein [Pseudomonadota bacterium]